MKAFADDLLLHLYSESEAKTIIGDLLSLDTEWRLSLNLKKSVTLTNSKLAQIEGIPCQQETKYLGVRISIHKNKTASFAKKDIKRHLGHIKYKLRGCNSEVKEHLVSAFGKSILRYVGTPLYEAKVLNEKAVHQMETSLYREAHSLPNSASNKSILSIARRQQPILESI